MIEDHLLKNDIDRFLCLLQVFLVDSETMKIRAEVMMEQKNSADRGFWLCGPKVNQKNKP